MKNFRSPQRPKKNTLIIGKQPIMNALRSGTPLERIFMQNIFYGKAVEDLLVLAQEHKVPVNKVPVQKAVRPMPPIFLISVIPSRIKNKGVSPFSTTNDMISCNS